MLFVCMSCKMCRVALRAYVNLNKWYRVICIIVSHSACDEGCILGSISCCVCVLLCVCLVCGISDCCSVLPGVYYLVVGIQVTCHQTSNTAVNILTVIHHVEISLRYVPKSRVTDHRIIHIFNVSIFCECVYSKYCQITLQHGCTPYS